MKEDCVDQPKARNGMASVTVDSYGVNEIETDIKCDTAEAAM